MFARDGFVAEHHADRASKVHENISALKALDDAAHDLPFASAPLVQNGIALRLAQLLQNHLLRRLRRDAAEVLVRLQRKHHLLAKLSIFLYFLRFVQCDVPLGIEARKFFLVVLYYYLFLFLAARRRRAFGRLRLFLFFNKTHRRLIHHGLHLPEFQLAGLLIHLALHHLAALAIFFFVCRRDRRLDHFHNLVRIQSFFFRNLLQRF